MVLIVYSFGPEERGRDTTFPLRFGKVAPHCLERFFGERARCVGRLADHIVNTSSLCYLHRAGILHVLPAIFSPGHVVVELSAGRARATTFPSRLSCLGRTCGRSRFCLPSWNRSAFSGQANARS